MRVSAGHKTRYQCRFVVSHMRAGEFKSCVVKRNGCILWRKRNGGTAEEHGTSRSCQRGRGVGQWGKWTLESSPHFD